ncbi:acyl-CoA dehydrogenase family protein [Paraburkholderia guartelaensis]|uniref:acyl-CoA dehydrogenase family protein n=1 Tax=Paraburkholderia guartelaensis TaxID=2546446 RepID=UPI002AB79779|nr:acyl-CoA dehydrogenase family protein [Paraburkholderia guartelaensis]
MSSTTAFALPASRHQREPESLSDLGRRTVEALKELVPMLRRNAQESERLGALAPETLKAISELGVFRLTLPAEYGGLALGARDIVEVITTLGSGDAAAGWLAIVSTGIRGELVFPERFVTEMFADAATWQGPLVAGANLLSAATGKARKVDGGWMIHGQWRYGSGSKHAAWAIVGVQYTTEDGTSHRARAVLPREQFRVLDDWHVMGQMGSCSNTITTVGEEEFVPDHRLFNMADLPEMASNLKGKYDGLAFKFGALGQMLLAPVSFAALSLGIAEACLESFAAQAQRLKPFNLDYPSVAQMPSVQVVAGKARAAINVARRTIQGYAEDMDRRALNDEDFDRQDEPVITMDLIYVINLLAKAIDSLQLALGSSTIALSNPIQRHVRDVRVLSTHGALRLDPMAEINGKQILGVQTANRMANFDGPVRK